MFLYNIRYSVLFKAMALALVCLFVASDLIYATPELRTASQSTLAALTQLNKPEFREAAAIRECLLASKGADKYINEQIPKEKGIFGKEWESQRTERVNIYDTELKGRINGKPIAGLDSVLFIKLAGFLASTGQPFQADLAGKGYDGLPVVYIDSALCNTPDKCIQKHEIDQILQWEDLRVNMLHIADKKAMRRWVRRYINDADQALQGTPYEGMNSRQIAKLFHGYSYPLRDPYKKLFRETDYDYEYIRTMLSIYGTDEESGELKLVARREETPAPHVRPAAAGTGVAQNMLSPEFTWLIMTSQVTTDIESISTYLKPIQDTIESLDSSGARFSPYTRKVLGDARKQGAYLCEQLKVMIQKTKGLSSGPINRQAAASLLNKIDNGGRFDEVLGIFYHDVWDIIRETPPTEQAESLKDAFEKLHSRHDRIRSQLLALAHPQIFTGKTGALCYPPWLIKIPEAPRSHIEINLWELLSGRRAISYDSWPSKHERREHILPIENEHRFFERRFAKLPELITSGAWMGINRDFKTFAIELIYLYGLSLDYFRIQKQVLEKAAIDPDQVKDVLDLGTNSWPYAWCFEEIFPNLEKAYGIEGRWKHSKEFQNFWAPLSGLDPTKYKIINGDFLEIEEIPELWPSSETGGSFDLIFAHGFKPDFKVSNGANEDAYYYKLLLSASRLLRPAGHIVFIIKKDELDKFRKMLALLEGRSWADRVMNMAGFAQIIYEDVDVFVISQEDLVRHEKILEQGVQAREARHEYAEAAAFYERQSDLEADTAKPYVLAGDEWLKGAESFIKTAKKWRRKPSNDDEWISWMLENAIDRYSRYFKAPKQRKDDMYVRQQLDRIYEIIITMRQGFFDDEESRLFVSKFPKKPATDSQRDQLINYFFLKDSGGDPLESAPGSLPLNVPQNTDADRLIGEALAEIEAGQRLLVQKKAEAKAQGNASILWNHIRESSIPDYELRLRLLYHMGILRGNLLYPLMGDDCIPAYFTATFGINYYTGIGKTKDIEAAEKALLKNGLPPAYKGRPKDLTVMPVNAFDRGVYFPALTKKGGIDTVLVKGLTSWSMTYEGRRSNKDIWELVEKIGNNLLRPGGCIIIADEKDLWLAQYLEEKLGYEDLLAGQGHQRIKQALNNECASYEAYLGDMFTIFGRVPIRVLRKPDFSPGPTVETGVAQNEPSPKATKVFGRNTVGAAQLPPGYDKRDPGLVGQIKILRLRQADGKIKYWANQIVGLDRRIGIIKEKQEYIIGYTKRADPLILLAVCGNKLAGFLLASGAGDGFGIDFFGVDPSIINHGIGTSLLSKALKIAKTNGKKKASLRVETRRARASGIYERLGFKRDVGSSDSSWTTMILDLTSRSNSISSPRFGPGAMSADQPFDDKLVPKDAPVNNSASGQPAAPKEVAPEGTAPKQPDNSNQVSLTRLDAEGQTRLVPKVLPQAFAAGPGEEIASAASLRALRPVGPEAWPRNDEMSEEAVIKGSSSDTVSTAEKAAKIRREFVPKVYELKGGILKLTESLLLDQKIDLQHLVSEQLQIIFNVLGRIELGSKTAKSSEADISQILRRFDKVHYWLDRLADPDKPDSGGSSLVDFAKKRLSTGTADSNLPNQGLAEFVGQYYFKPNAEGAKFKEGFAKLREQFIQIETEYRPLIASLLDTVLPTGRGDAVWRANATDIENALQMLTKLIPEQEQVKEKELTYYTIRYDADKMPPLAEELLKIYAGQILPAWLPGKERVKLIATKGQSEGIIWVNCYKDQGRSQLAGTGHVDIHFDINEDINGRALRIMGMLNIALAASHLPDNLSTDDMDKYNALVSFIQRQYKDITGEDLTADALKNDNKNIWINLPPAEHVSPERADEYYRLTITQLRQSA
ncbi:MAG: GNAT family N-acetyltransferase [Candidatus Omnitrophota bacterium]|nr:GNAT family N-acetyltransferase [Candidatus Omnitrophota bacterium]